MDERMCSGRLLLKPLPLDGMTQIWRKDPSFLKQSVISQVILDAVAHKMDQMRQGPSDLHPWLTYWLIQEKESKEGIGLIGCKSLPDPQGYVELGYAMARECRRKGYMTEALLCFLDWLYGCPFCNGAMLSIQCGNEGSRKVAKRCGFVCEGIKEGSGLYRYRF